MSDHSSLSQKNFHLGDLLSVTTGLLVSSRGFDGVYEILNFLTGDDLMTHQLPRACRAAADWLTSQYPELHGPTAALQEAAQSPGWPASLEIIMVRLATDFCQGARLLPYLEIRSMPRQMWLHVDPLQELAAMIGNDKIIVVVEPE